MFIAKWDFIEIVCGVCGDKMELKNGKWGCYYICKNSEKCFNKVNSDIYEKILDKITEILGQDCDKKIESNHTGMTWQYKTSRQHYRMEIKKHYATKMIVSVKNMKQYREK